MLVAELGNEAGRYELQAAFHREFIPDGYAASDIVRHALDAAVCAGKAQALREAVAAIEAHLGL